ncbi:hypothetical protein [Actinomadura sp. 21ATH]|uniref:hypothetical protein n=1 Tax=Actinomadura sp. 21ATH TaxID=1735444 RepID=UPI0035C07B13
MTTVRALLRALLPGPRLPWRCTGCGRRTRRLTPAQHASAGSGLLPACRCGGTLLTTSQHNREDV